MRSLHTMLLVLVLSSGMLFSQKRAVGLTHFPYNSSSCDREAAITIYNYVVQGFDASQRFTVLDRLFGTQVVSDEQELTKEEIFMDGDLIVEKGRVGGAEWMVSGQIMTANATPYQVEDSEGRMTTQYRPDIAFFLRIYDVETSEVIASEVITPQGRALGSDLGNTAAKSGFLEKFFQNKGAAGLPTGNSPTSVLQQGMMNVVPHIKSFISDNFPYYLETFKVETDEYGVTRVAALVPSDMGAELNQLFNVIYKDIEIFGDQRIVSKQVKGDLKVDELAGKVMYLVPKLKKDDFLFDLIRDEPEKIILAESGDKSSVWNNISIGGDKEKQQRRKESRQEKKNQKGGGE